MKKEYLGDGVYIAFDGFSYILTTENGITIDNTIYLEQNEIDNLNDYVKRTQEAIR